MSAEPSDIAITELGLPTYTQLRNRVAELEARCAELGHSYDVTFKRRVELEAMLVQLLEDLDAEFGPGRVDVNWPKLRDLART